MLKVAVITCPKYSSLLKNFRILFERYWGGPFDVIGETQDLGYAKNLVEYLKTIGDDYVVILHEDFFITQRVDQKALEAVLGFAFANQLDRFGLQSVEDGYRQSIAEYHGQYFKIKEGFKYLCSFEASIWRRGFLLEHLNPKWDPWETETLLAEAAPNAKVFVPEKTIVSYKDAMIHGQERVTEINGRLFVMVPTYVPLGVDL